MITGKTFPERLKAVRKASMLTQQIVATALGIDRSTYTYYETGKTRPDLPTLVRLAQMFGVSTDELLGCAGQEASFHDDRSLFEDRQKMRFSSLTDDEKILVLQFRQLNEGQKSTAMQQLQHIFFEKNKELAVPPSDGT